MTAGNHLEPTVEAALRASFLAAADRNVVLTAVRWARIWAIPAGYVFIDQSKPHRCGLVVSGLARIYTVRLDGTRSTIRRVGPGAAVGVRALVGHRNSVTAQAITDLDFLEIDARTLVELGRSNVSLAWAIAEEINRRLADTELQLESALAGTVIQRLSGALLDLVGEGEPEIVMSHESLAELVGASRERVGHALRILARDGLLVLRRGRVRLLDPLQLQSVARDPGAPANRNPMAAK